MKLECDPEADATYSKISSAEVEGRNRQGD